MINNSTYLEFYGSAVRHIRTTIWGLAAGGASQQSYNASHAAKIH